jgi:hypothetical protein
MSWTPSPHTPPPDMGPSPHTTSPDMGQLDKHTDRLLTRGTEKPECTLHVGSQEERIVAVWAVLPTVLSNYHSCREMRQAESRNEWKSSWGQGTPQHCLLGSEVCAVHNLGSCKVQSSSTQAVLTCVISRGC